MANKLIAEMDLPNSICNVFSARNIRTAKEVLSLTEFELMELLDVSLEEVSSAVSHVSAIVSPPYLTAWILMKQKIGGGKFGGRITTRLKGLDDALCGGIPIGVLTEVVGPAGIGKTQFCMKMSLLAALPVRCGGMDGQVIYIDVESKFNSKRMIEIGAATFPEIFNSKEMAKEMAGRILVFQPSSLSDFTESLEKIKLSIFQNRVTLLVVDSMTALVSGECSDLSSKNQSLGWHISFMKSLAELGRIPVLVTNQVRSQSRNETCNYQFEKNNCSMEAASYDSHLVAALGMHWSHAVTIRLVLEAKSGQRFIKIAKSPMSPSYCFPYTILSSGIVLLNDEGIELHGSDITSISNSGKNKFEIVYGKGQPY